MLRAEGLLTAEKAVEIMEGNIDLYYASSGEHMVEFRYIPPLLNLSFIISFVGIIACIVLYKKRNNG